LRCRRLMVRTTMKIAKATIRNWTTVLMNSPTPIATAGTSSPAALTVASRRVQAMSEKSTPPSSRPIGGMITLSTSEVTILPNAAPMTTPTARSTTLPRIANSLNSVIMPIVVSCFRGRAVVRPSALCVGCAYLATQFEQIVQARDAGIARRQRGDSGGRAHEHQVACAQRVEFRQLVQDPGHVPDHPVERGLLAALAVDLQRQQARRELADPGGRHQFADRRRGVETLGAVPGQAGGLGGRLQVAAGQVEADAVAEHQRRGIVHRH